MNGLLIEVAATLTVEMLEKLGLLMFLAISVVF
jgi:hypothetical protein